MNGIIKNYKEYISSITDLINDCENIYNEISKFQNSLLDDNIGDYEFSILKIGKNINDLKKYRENINASNINRNIDNELISVIYVPLQLFYLSVMGESMFIKIISAIITALLFGGILKYTKHIIYLNERLAQQIESVEKAYQCFLTVYSIKRNSTLHRDNQKNTLSNKTNKKKKKKRG